MKQFVLKGAVVLLAAVICASLVPLGMAQVSGAYTTVSTSPNGLLFSVDGQNFTQTMAAYWPAGSKHTLFASPTQFSSMNSIQYTFQSWTWAGGQLGTTNQVVVTADPTISSYQAVFNLTYAVNLDFFACPSGNCQSPGTIYINGTAFQSDATVYVAPGTSVVLQAFPNDGYVFAGWGSTNSGTLIQGFQQTYSITQPTTFYPQFQLAREIDLATVPANLQVYADRAPVTTPTSLQWGIGSTHTVGAVTPQADKQGVLWVFSSWSDAGASTHSYAVTSSSLPISLTATYVPGALVGFSTNPQGLSLSIDGRTNWLTYNFTWGVGETHTVSAPAQQTDAQGNVWNFSNWSTGGPATQTITVPASAATTGMRMTANYTEATHLTVTAPIAGLPVTVNGSPCALPCNVYQSVGAQVDVGVPVTVPISAASRQDFLSWTVNGAAGTATAPNGDLLVTLGASAVTVSPVYHMMNALAVSANPVAGATFSLQPSSPDNFYDSQASVTITASILPGYKFGSWSGDLSGTSPTATIAMSAPRSVAAILLPVPYILPGGIVNGAGVTPQLVLAPGSVVSVFGVNLAPAVAVGASSPMVQTLGGVTAHVGAQVLPLYFVSPTQINFQLPPSLPPGPQTLIVSSPGQPDVQAVFQVAADAPGIFPSSVAAGVTFGVVTHADGSEVTSASPAQAGETLTLFGTGFGPTIPTRPEGFAVPAAPAYLLTDPATVQLGAVSLTPSNAFAWPGAVGVDVIQFVVPAGLPSGANSPLTVTIGGTAGNTVQLPIQ